MIAFSSNESLIFFSHLNFRVREISGSSISSASVGRRRDDGGVAKHFCGEGAEHG